jgi:hypothetical protein
MPNQSAGVHDINARIDAYKRDVDRTLLRENLKLTPEQRLAKLMAHQQFAASLREAGRKARSKA